MNTIKVSNPKLIYSTTKKLHLQNGYVFLSDCVSLTIAAVLFCFLLVVLDEQLSLSASHLTALRQLVQNLHCACVHFKLRHRLLPKHLPEPLAHLQLHSIRRCTVDTTCKSFEIQESISTVIKTKLFVSEHHGTLI